MHTYVPPSWLQSHDIGECFRAPRDSVSAVCQGLKGLGRREGDTDRAHRIRRAAEQCGQGSRRRISRGPGRPARDGPGGTNAATPTAGRGKVRASFRSRDARPGGGCAFSEQNGRCPGGGGEEERRAPTAFF